MNTIHALKRTTQNAKMTPKARTVTNVADNSSMARHPFITFESISERPKTNQRSYEDDCNEYYSNGRTRRNSPYAEAILPSRNLVTQAVIDVAALILIALFLCAAAASLPLALFMMMLSP
jgi:hypothetical protein